MLVAFFFCSESGIKHKGGIKMSLLTLENIHKEYRNKLVLNDVSLRVERGERVALVGANGTGKTTLLKIAMGLETCDSGNIIRSKVKTAYLSQDMQEIQESQDITALQYEKVIRVEQKLRKIEKEMEQLSGHCESLDYNRLMGEYSRLTAEYEIIDGYTVETKIKKILLGLGLKQDVLTLPIGSMSGGERMRVALTRMLLEEPDLIILDEPTNHLDIQAVEWLEEFLKKFEGGVLFVSHDRYFLDKVATRIAELENGSIIEKSCSYTSFMEQKKRMREFYLKEQKNLGIRIRNASKITQDLRSLGRIRASKSREKEVERLKAQLSSHKTSFKNSEHSFGETATRISLKKIKHVSKDIAFAENLKKSFGQNVIFKGADFHIMGGEKIGVIGANGCGKTTLINLLMGIDKEYEGFIRLGEWVNYAYLAQNVEFEDEERTVIEEILSKKEMPEPAARNLLAGFQFYGDEVDKKLKVLSGGERVKLYFACIMLDEPDCLIMDEPTNHLDLPSKEAIEAAIKGFKGTIIAITHDRYFLTNSVGKILEIENGKINTYEGNYEYYKAAKAFEKGNSLSPKCIQDSKYKRTGSIVKVKKEQDTLKKAEVISQEKLETSIIELEERIKTLENSFTAETPPHIYSEYADLTNQLGSLYSLWEQHDA
jgi:ATP-binding cassette subfamily F protein 3